MEIGLNNFEDFIDPVILERGLQYWQDGFVTDVEEVGQNDFTAVIVGSEAYVVNLVLNKANEIFTHFCSCPYDHGNFCKHEVALLYTVKTFRQKGIPFPKGEIHMIQSEIQGLSKKALQQLVMELAKGNLETRGEVLFLLGLNG